MKKKWTDHLFAAGHARKAKASTPPTHSWWVGLGEKDFYAAARANYERIAESTSRKPRALSLPS